MASVYWDKKAKQYIANFKVGAKYRKRFTGCQTTGVGATRRSGCFLLCPRLCPRRSKKTPREPTRAKVQLAGNYAEVLDK